MNEEFERAICIEKQVKECSGEKRIEQMFGYCLSFRLGISLPWRLRLGLRAGDKSRSHK